MGFSFSDLVNPVEKIVVAKLSVCYTDQHSNLLDPDIIGINRLQSPAYNHLMHFIHTPGIGDLKLLIPLFLFPMAANANRTLRKSW